MSTTRTTMKSWEKSVSSIFTTVESKKGGLCKLWFYIIKAETHSHFNLEFSFMIIINCIIFCRSKHCDLERISFFQPFTKKIVSLDPQNLKLTLVHCTKNGLSESDYVWKYDNTENLLADFLHCRTFRLNLIPIF